MATPVGGATKENHTSNDPAPKKPHAGKGVMAELVAPTFVYVVKLHVLFTVRLNAPQGLLFVGAGGGGPGAVAQMLNAPKVSLPYSQNLTQSTVPGAPVYDKAGMKFKKPASSLQLTNVNGPAEHEGDV